MDLTAFNVKATEIINKYCALVGASAPNARAQVIRYLISLNPREHGQRVKDLKRTDNAGNQPYLPATLFAAQEVIVSDVEEERLRTARYDASGAKRKIKRK